MTHLTSFHMLLRRIGHMVIGLFLCNKPHRNSGLKQQFNHFCTHECWGWAQLCVSCSGAPCTAAVAQAGVIAKVSLLTWGPPCASFPCGLSSIAAQGSQTDTKRIKLSFLATDGLWRALILRCGKCLLSHLEQAGRYFASKFSYGPGRWDHLFTNTSH